MSKFIPIDSKYISYIVSTKTKTVPKLDASTSLPIWENIETGEQVLSATNPDPGSNYVPVMTSTEVAVVSISIDKEGIPEGAKKLKISYLYLNNNSSESESPIEPKPEEPDVEQPESGTINTVNLDINIDENTQYPLTGEFELDGTPQSIEGTIKKMVTYRIAQASIYDIGFDSTPISDAVTSDTQAEFLDFNDWNSPGGIAIKGSHYE